MKSSFCRMSGERSAVGAVKRMHIAARLEGNRNPRAMVDAVIPS